MIERGLLTLHPGLPHDSRVPRSARDLRHLSYISLTGQLSPLDRARSRDLGVPAEEIRVWRGRSCLAHSLTRLLAGSAQDSLIGRINFLMARFNSLLGPQ
jgi:hypothetical protein